MDLLTANRLQQYRKMNGYSQEVLAEKLGISRQSISKWERAESSPELDNLIALAKIYGITVDELLDTTSDKVVVTTPTKKNRDIRGKLKSLLFKANDFGLYPELAKKLLLFPYPIIIVIAYIALSASFRLWHPLWLLFLTIPVYYRFAIACKAGSKRAFALLLPVPEIVVALYIILCMIIGAWGAPALLFIIIPIYYWATLLIKN